MSSDRIWRIAVWEAGQGRLGGVGGEIGWKSESEREGQLTCGFWR